MNVRCSFCGKGSDAVQALVAGAGVFICDECVDLCVQVIATRKSADSVPRVPTWENIDDAALLAHLPRIEAVRHQVDDDLRAWVAEARRRELSWDRIGDALGMKRQSAWERFATSKS
ncbi:MAG TPA: ClpX C4-type zinc finger protein [Micromonosporaceae bacterium]|jgi:hypothetical protein